MSYLAASRNLSSNYFNGSIIPTSIFNTLANLTILDLSHNNFTGLLPDLSTFSNSLTQLNLSFNSFNPEPYPAWVKGFNQLSMLSLKRNGLSGPFPYDLASLPNLEILELDNNTFNGTLHINDIGHLGNTLSYGNTSLQILSIQFNNIINVDDYYPENITNITTVFMLQGNPYCTSNEQSIGQSCYCNQICHLSSGEYKHFD
jgi:Leucine-rich repeat (LRR) protein